MDCVICKHGQTQPGTTPAILTQGGTTLVVKNAPAEICDNCEEYYLSETVAERLLQLGEEAVTHGAEIEFLRYAA